MQLDRKTVNVCTAGMIVYKRIVVDLILKIFLPLSYFTCCFFFFFSFLKDAHSNLEVNVMYLFIYLFGSLQLQASTAAAIVFFSSSDLGTFSGRATTLALFLG